MERYRGRFAPSPTGPLHFGSLVAAVASYLDAKSCGGEWLVRIDDLDPPRVEAGAAEDILHTLEACGMQWDGAIVHQSKRADAYHAALHKLRQRGRVYPCACSRREIADSAVSGIDGYVYPGTCRSGLPPAARARTLRIDTRGVEIDFGDALQGRFQLDLDADLGDFVLYRFDRVFAYQLAVVIDDAEQGITHIVRGADLLDSTPRQIYLQQLLGLPTPHYAHLPVAVNVRGEKLSKQTFAPPIDPSHPNRALFAALRFLGQEPPAYLQDAQVSGLWAWAIDHWQLASIPERRSVSAPDFDMA